MWWGIDGELKSEFGELTEKFWKSSSWGNPIQAKNFQAIYFANEGGGSDGGGKELKKLGSNGGEKLLKEAGEKVERFFGYCVGSIQNGNGCRKDNNNSSVVLVGSDNQLSPELKQKIKNEWNWTSGDGSVVDGGRRYSKIFEGIQTKSRKPRNSGKFNWPTLNRYISTSRERRVLLENLCPWIKKINDESGRQCESGNFRGASEDNLRLPQFLNSDYAKNYFREPVWGQYPIGGKYVALLALLNLWSTDLSQMNFDLSKDIFDTNQEKFKLEHLTNSNGKVVYLDADNSGNHLKTISYHSGGMWTIQLCPNSGGCSNNEGLNLTMGNEKFCVVKDVCFSESDNRRSISNGRDGWKRLMGDGSGLWNMVFRGQAGTSPSRAMFISLIVACFKDVEKVSLSINANPRKEKCC